MSNSLLVLHGPGTAEQLPPSAVECCSGLGLALDFYQSGNVNELCDILMQRAESSLGLILNPYSSESASTSQMEKYNEVLENIENEKILIIELHLDNVMANEKFDAAPLTGPAGRMGMVCGLGEAGYRMAMNNIARKTGTDQQ